MGFENFDLVKTLRTFGGLSGLVVCILGIWQLVTSALNPKTTINGCYQILFGILAITAEFRLEQVLTHFKFLTHFLGLGLFYIFVGGLALGGAWYNIAVAIILLAVGILYTSLGVCCRRFGQETFDAKPPLVPSQGQEGENQPISEQPSSYEPPLLNNRPASSSNSDIHPPSRSPWDNRGDAPGAGEKRGSYSAVPSSVPTDGGGKRSSISNKGAWGDGAWSAAHSEGDVNFPRALIGVAIDNPQQTVAVASAVASNPIARSAAQGAWSAAQDSARAGGKEDQIKKSSMDARQLNPFAEQ